MNSLLFKDEQVGASRVICFCC